MTPRRAWVILAVNAALVVFALVLTAIPWYLERPGQVPRAPASPVADLTGAPFVSAGP